MCNEHFTDGHTLTGFNRMAHETMMRHGVIDEKPIVELNKTKRSRSTTLSLMVIFTSLFLSGCMMPSFWLDDSDFKDNLPDNSILTYYKTHGASDNPVIALMTEHASYQNDFLKMFPLGDDVIHAKEYLMGIGANCKAFTAETETLNVCVYRRKVRTYRGIGFLGANKSFWANKIVMYEGWINVVYNIKSKRGVIMDITVETTDEPIYHYTAPPDRNRDIDKEIENCRLPECIRAF